MPIFKRLQAVVVMQAIFILAFSILQVIVPGFNLIDAWFGSAWMQILTVFVFWILSPFMVRVVEGRKREKEAGSF